MLDALKSEVLRYAMKMANAGLVPNTQGNVSARDPETGLVAITAHDHPYDIMTADDIVVVSLDGKVVEGRLAPSAETPVHCVVYRERPWVNGIVHAEPTYANVLGTLGLPIEPITVSLALGAGGAVPVMPFAPQTGSEEFGYRMLAVMGDRRAVIWGNHGCLTIGKTLDAAFRCTVVVENSAQIYYLARQMGRPNLVGIDSHGQLHA
jgi:L-ribulose-5-phosphate 4-epimerase